MSTLIGITIYIENNINTHLYTHHGIFINLDTIANQKRQLLNICMPTSFAIGSALTVVRTGG